MDDFISFICQLNGSDPRDGFDTFEIGSVSVDPPTWPQLEDTETRRRDQLVREILERPLITGDPLKKKKTTRHQDQESSLLPPPPKDAAPSCRPDLAHRRKLPLRRLKLPILSIQKHPDDPNPKATLHDQEIRTHHQAAVNHVINNKTSTDQILVMDKGKGTGFTVCPRSHGADSKLEASKRKLREQYEKIENQRKRRCIQIIEFQQSLPVQTKAKKPPVVRKLQSRRNRRLAKLNHAAPHVSVC